MKRLKVTASTSPFDYKTDMMTEDDVKGYNLGSLTANRYRF